MRAIAWAAVVLAVAMLTFVNMNGALAHDHSRPDLDKWYQELRNKDGTGCCDGGDFKRVEDPDWETKDGKYRVRLDGVWYDVPDSALVTTPNKVGHTLVWPVVYSDGSVHIRCFMPGAMT